MQPQFPLEILELIVDHVGADEDKHRFRDLLSLCISGRAFVARCQLYIFHSVTLYPPSRIPKALIPPRIMKEYRKTLRFEKSVSRKPFLALHVRELNYQLTSVVGESDLRFYKLLGALKSMTNVSNLTLGFDESLPIVPFLSITSPTWKQTMNSMIRSPKMRHLTLRNVISIPLDVVFNASSFHTLELRNTDINPREDDHPHLRVPNRYLRSLTCDTVSFLANSKKLLKLSASPISPDLSKLEKFDLTISSDVFRSTRLAELDVLRQSTHLRELRLTTIETLSSEPLPCVLDQLAGDCAWSLKHLTFTSVLYVDSRGVVSGPVIALPYRGLTESTVFPQLDQLESLTIRVVIQASLNLGPWSFGSQWGLIVDILDRPHTFPMLRKLTIEVNARVLDDEGEVLRVANNFQADSLLSTIRRSVYPAYLSRLEGLHKGGEHVEFVFRTVKKEGHRLR